MKSALSTAETWNLTFIAWPVNPSVAADSRCYIYFKCLCLHLCGTVFFCFA